MRTAIYGSKGTIIVDNSSADLSLFKAENEGSDMFNESTENMSVECRIPVKAIKHNIHGEIKDFVDSILNDSYPEVNGVEGGKTVAVCCAIVESAAKGEKIAPDYTIAEI